MWNRAWGGSGCDIGHSVWSDGTCIYTLGTTSFGAGFYDLVLIKWDTSGNIVWNRTWGGWDEDRGFSIWGDGTYLYTLGYTRSFGAGDQDFALLKWNLNGEVIWKRFWGGAYKDFGHSIFGDGTYLYTLGETKSFGADAYDLALVKWDTHGEVLWYRTWGGSGGDFGHSIFGDGTYLYTLGYTNSFGATSGDFLLIKWDASGNIVWNRTWGGTDTDIGNSIFCDGTYLYTLGYTGSWDAGKESFALVQWDVNGNVCWNRTWEGSRHAERGNSIWGDGTYLYTLGCTGSFGAQAYDLALVKWNIYGEVLWYRTWGGASDERGNSIWGDGSHVYTLGEIGVNNSGSYFFLLIKWGPDSGLTTSTTITTLATASRTGQRSGSNNDVSDTVVLFAIYALVIVVAIVAIAIAIVAIVSMYHRIQEY